MIRVERHPHESNIGYLQRIALANAYDDLKLFMAEFFPDVSNNVNWPHFPLYLYFEVVENPDATLGINVVKPNHIKDKRLDYGKIKLREQHFSVHKKVCPECLKEHQIEHGAWEHIFFVACPIHKIRLVQFPQNHPEFSYRKKPFEFDLQMLESPSSSVSAANQFIKLDNRDYVSKQVEGFEPATPLEVSIAQILKELYETGKSSSDYVPKVLWDTPEVWLESIFYIVDPQRASGRHPVKFELAKLEFSKRVEYVEDYEQLWLEMDQFLISMYEGRSLVDIYSDEFHPNKHLKNYKDWVGLRNLRKYAPFLKEHFDNFIFDKSGFRPNSVNSTTIPGNLIGSIKVRQILEISNEVYQLFLKQGILNPYKLGLSNFSSKMPLFKEQDINKLKEYLPLKWERFHQKYGLANRKLNDLVALGVVIKTDFETGNDNFYFLNEDFIQAHSERLKNPISLYDAMHKFKVANVTYSILIDEIKQGDLGCQVVVNSRIKVFVSQSDLLGLKPKYFSVTDECKYISREQVCKEFQITNRAVFNLAKEGFIESTPKSERLSPHDVYLKSSVEDFFRDYIVLSQISDLIGLHRSTRLTRKILDELGVFPAYKTPYLIYDRASFIVHRSDIEKQAMVCRSDNLPR
ncbi:TniQ family protein [Thiomicrorhabdus cannonii]|uniref:TniQ family protein n=1 Tax=Thiomicrorhabdus cannonii TaxID=2748011 RepID=UPI0015BE425A|nr:TniQ family protein [Thiomicrorhabdus cannonii]